MNVEKVVDPSYEEPEHDHRIFRSVTMEGFEIIENSDNTYGDRPAVRTTIIPNIVEYRLDGEHVETVRVDWEGASDETVREYLDRST